MSAGDGVEEGQRVRVQGETAGELIGKLGAVEKVARNGTANGGKVYADLMRAACFQT